MRVVNGKQIKDMDALALAAWRERYAEIVIDLGAGDGRFVRQLAGRHPERGVIGVDLCAANLRAASRAAGKNALFVIADALALPEELHGMATRVTVHFPWGSLLRGLLTGDPRLVQGLRRLGSERTCYEITLNAGALAEAGWAFASGSEQVLANLRPSGFHIDAMRLLSPAELRTLPSTWAKRLAFGRDPRAVGYRLSATGCQPLVAASTALNDVRARPDDQKPIADRPSQAWHDAGAPLHPADRAIGGAHEAGTHGGVAVGGDQGGVIGKEGELGGRSRLCHVRRVAERIAGV